MAIDRGNAAIVEEAMDEKRISEIVRSIVEAVGSIDAAFRELVSSCCDLKPREAEAVRQRIAKQVPAYAGWINRACACASRGLDKAYHLYGPTTVLTAAQIKGASAAALRSVADPEHEFPFVSDSGSLSMVRSKDLDRPSVNRVWCMQVGAISEKQQRATLKSELAGQDHDAGDGVEFEVKAVRHVSRGGEDFLVINCRPVDGAADDIKTQRFRVKDLARYFRR